MEKFDTATENGNAVHALRDDIIKHQNLYDEIKIEINKNIQVIILMWIVKK